MDSAIRHWKRGSPKAAVTPDDWELLAKSFDFLGAGRCRQAPGEAATRVGGGAKFDHIRATAGRPQMPTADSGVAVTAR